MLPGESWDSNISKAPEQEAVPQPKPAFPFLQSPSPSHNLLPLPAAMGGASPSHQGLTEPCQCHHKRQECPLLGEHSFTHGKEEASRPSAPLPAHCWSREAENPLHSLPGRQKGLEPQEQPRCLGARQSRAWHKACPTVTVVLPCPVTLVLLLWVFRVPVQPAMNVASDRSQPETCPRAAVSGAGWAHLELLEGRFQPPCLSFRHTHLPLYHAVDHQGNPDASRARS